MAAFQFLERCASQFGEAVPLTVLRGGFDFEGKRICLMGPKGIFKPAILPEMPLSITTVPIVAGKDRPYEDEMSPDGYLTYRYRGEDPRHPDNEGLKKAMLRGTQLIYFYGLVKGIYMPVWPVYVVGADDATLSFQVAVDDAHQIHTDGFSGAADDMKKVRRQYITATTQVRMHQRSFRERVILAYRRCCAICRLKHPELLEAAHIIPDRNPRGRPTVNNGLALCTLHHRAFDRHVLGIRPDYKIDLRPDILEEEDGPMLRHGLQGFQGKTILLPRRQVEKPSQRYLEERYEQFRQAG